MRRPRVIILAVILTAGWLRGAYAGAPEEFRVNPSVDVPIVAAAVVAWIGSEAAKSTFAPGACRWCDSNGIDDGVRSWLKWGDTARANTLSNFTGFVVAPVAALGLPLAAAPSGARARHFIVDVLIIAEATALSADLNQATKFLVGRERPFVHALSPDEKRSTPAPADNNLSFYSGHSNLVFALAASSGTVASLRRYRLAPMIWVTGLAAAAATGYLRIAADKHYVTDVLTGAVVGTLAGGGLPMLLHRSGGANAVRGPIVITAPTREGAVILASVGF